MKVIKLLSVLSVNRSPLISASLTPFLTLKVLECQVSGGILVLG